MEHLKAVRTISKVAAVFLTIAKVFLIIGLVFEIIGLIAIAVIPSGFLRFTTENTATVSMNFSSIYGEAWNEIRDSVVEAMPKGFDSEAELTENGIDVKVPVSSSASGRELALTMVPVILSTACFILFCSFLAKALRAIQSGAEPFSFAAADNFRRAGVVLIVASSAPGLTASILSNFTDAPFSSEWDLAGILTGVLLLGLGSLFAYQTEKGTPPAAPAAPFGGYHFDPPAGTPPQDPSSGSDNDPRAF